MYLPDRAKPIRRFPPGMGNPQTMVPPIMPALFVDDAGYGSSTNALCREYRFCGVFIRSEALK
jgi:hypothetical protein